MVFDRGWILNAEDEPLAKGRLAGIVANLTRQRWRQLLLENACAGLFWGIAVSTVAAAAIKLAAPGVTVPIVVAPIVALALAAALLKTWFDRPDRLQVAILADLQLRLKQRLSTAWEFAERDLDPALARYLAVQAVNQRYPPRHQPVFRMRATVPARLLPLVALLLILVSIVDLPRLQGQTALLVDDLVVSEGTRLREFARQMRVRAQREGLHRSTAESENMRRLGARMESGSISREQALHRLQDLGEALSEQRRAALADTANYAPGTIAVGPAAGSDAARWRELLEQLMQGRLTPGELDLSGQETRDLSSIGITTDALQEALDNFVAGEPEDLRQIVTELSRVELAAEDADELGRAGQRVAQARENLGDLSADSEEFMASGSGVDIATHDDDAGVSGAMFRRSADKNDLTTPAERGMGMGSGATQRHPAQSLNARSPRDDVALRPQSRLRDGISFATEAWVLPRAGQPRVSTAQIDPQFAAQVEEVFAREQYPLHHKEFIRRYFLELSRGAAGATRNEKEQQ